MTKSPKIYPTNAELWLNMHSSGARHPSIHAFIHCSCYALPEVIPVWGVYTTFLCMSVPAKATLPRAMHATRVIGGDLHRHRVVVAGGPQSQCGLYYPPPAQRTQNRAFEEMPGLS